MDTENLPPTQKGRQYEIRALGLRDFAGLRRDDEPLNPFELARYAKLLVVSFEQIEPFLSEETKAHLLGEGRDKWSGGACSQTLHDGRKLIVLNPTHGENRQNATLMEEVRVGPGGQFQAGLAAVFSQSIGREAQLFR